MRINKPKLSKAPSNTGTDYEVPDHIKGTPMEFAWIRRKHMEAGLRPEQREGYKKNPELITGLDDVKIADMPREAGSGDTEGKLVVLPPK